MAKKRKPAVLWLRNLLIAAGTFLILLNILAATTLPFWAYYRLGTSGSQLNAEPAHIILLSGAGMPSESALMRAYYTAELAAKFPSSDIVIAMPGNINDPQSDPCLLRNELKIRGIYQNRIQFATAGHNTRGQALELADVLPDKNQALLIVTSPDHMKRAVLAFRKCGFTHVGGQPTFEHSLGGDLRFDDKGLKGNEMIPRIGNKLQIRYQFWNHLKYEILVLHEYFALGYYKLRGWI